MDIYGSLKSNISLQKQRIEAKICMALQAALSQARIGKRKRSLHEGRSTVARYSPITNTTHEKILFDLVIARKIKKVLDTYIYYLKDYYITTGIG